MQKNILFTSNFTTLSSFTQKTIASAIKCILLGVVLGLSGISVMAAPTGTITINASLNDFNSCYTNVSTEQNFTVSGSSSGNILVTPPSSFEVSTDNINYFSNITLTADANDDVSSTTIYIRLASTNYGNYTNDIVCTAPLASTETHSITWTVYDDPQASIDPVDDVCERDYASISAFTQFGSSIQWTTSNGNGSIADDNTDHPTYRPDHLDAGNTVILTLTVSNGYCSDAVAYVDINVKGVPEVTLYSTGSTICETGTAIMSAYALNYDNIQWSTNGNGSFDNNGSESPTYTPNPSDVGSITLTMKASSNVCSGYDDEDYYSLDVIAAPVADITGSGTQSICPGEDITISTAGASSGTDFEWGVYNISGNGSLTNSHSLAPTYTSVLSDAGNTVQLILLASRYPCTDVTAYYSFDVKAATSAPTGAATQYFITACNKTLADLDVTGTNIKWYDAASGGTELPSSTALTNTTYYASQTVNGCEGTSRLAVTATPTTTYTYTGSGDWTTTSNWTPCYPGTTVPSGYRIYNNPSETLTIPSGTTITVADGTIFCDGNLTVEGQLNISNSQSVRAITFTNANGGIVNLSSGSSLIADYVSFNNNNGAIINNSGTLNCTNGAVFANAGTINNNSNGIIINNLTFDNTGGTFNNNSGSTYNGIGDFSGSLFTNGGGTVAPGNSPGCQSYAGGFTNSTGSLSIEVNGTTACSGYDQLQVTGTATLSGTLDVSIGYTPSNNDQITFITATTAVTGTFATVNAPTGWAVSYTSTEAKLTYTTTNVQVAGSVSADGNYNTLADAFTAINTYTQTSATIAITVIGNTTEPSSGATLNAGAWTSLSVKPSGGAARTITGAITAGSALITLNDADNVTIDGLNTGSNSLTLSNTTASNTSATSTIKFINGATNNTVTKCTVLGSFAGASSVDGGTVYFATDASTSNGNDGNTISNNNIGPAGSNLPSRAIYSLGTNTSSTYYNSNNSISANNIYDYFSATEASAGIYLAGGTTDFTIQNNKLYQAATRTQSAIQMHSAIWLNSTEINNCTISGNTIGYASSSGTGTYTFVGIQVSGTGGSQFYPIYINNHGTTTATNIDNNTITNIAFSGTQFGVTFSAIYVQSGIVNIGVNTGNTIGSTSASNAITYTSSSASYSSIYLIGYFASSNATISNNTIGGIDISRSAGQTIVYGIVTSPGSSFTNTITNNTIGYVSAPITMVGGITNGTAYSFLSAIRALSGAAVITNNTINTIQTNFTSPGFVNLQGISANSVGNSSGDNISQNNIHSLSNSLSSASGAIVAIDYTGATSGTHSMSKNNIHSLNCNSTAESLYGFFIRGGLVSCTNNMIRLGYDEAGSSITTGAIIRGIYESGGSNNYYFNSVYIGGSGVTGTNLTYAMRSAVTSNTRNFKNNICYNARSNGSGSGNHYAILLSGTGVNPTGLTSNYNDLLANGTGGILGNYNGNLTTLSAWQTATGQDANSQNSDPQYINPTGTSSTVDLHIHASNATPVEGTGVAISGITDDFDGQTRSGLTPTDMGADARSFTTALEVNVKGNGTTPASIVDGDASPSLTDSTDFGAVTISTSLVRRYTIENTGSAILSINSIVSSGTNASEFVVTNYNTTIAAGSSGTFIVTYTPTAAGIRTATITINNNDADEAVYDFSVQGGSSCLTGTYTIGSGGDYATLTAAVAAYNTTCLSGPVEFSLIDNTYSSETYPIVITANADASSTNTLTIKPASGKTPTFSAAAPFGSSYSPIRLNGADYIIIDGSNTTNGTSHDLSIINTYSGGYSGGAIWLSNATSSDGATNNIIKNCVLSGYSASLTKVVVFSTGVTWNSQAQIANSNNTYQNNQITKGEQGIFVAGPSGMESGLVITGNEIGSSTAGEILQYGIYLYGQQNMTISNNTIHGIYNNNSNYSTGGILLVSSSAFSGGSITGNTIYDIKNTTTASYGIYLNASNTSSNAIGLKIANNFIFDIAGGGSSNILNNGHGIFVVTGYGYNIWHNTVLMNTNQTSAGKTSAIFINNHSSISSGAIDLRNNILVNTQTTGDARAIWSLTGSGIFSSIDYNNYYTAGAYLGMYNTSTTCTTLTNIVTYFGGNTNSTTINPTFTSATDLHLPPSSNTSISNLGVYISSVTTDFDGESRSTSRPDMGADEFDPAPTAGLIVKGNSIDIADGNTTPSAADSTDFGTRVITTSLVRRYTVVNNGGSAITMSSITSSGTNASQFVVTSNNMIIGAGSSGTFIVTFTPTSTGSKTATITVNSNDATTPVYDFAVQGNGTSTATFSGNGDWTNPTKWSPNYPGLTISSGISVIISAGATLTIPASTTIVNNGTVTNNGTITNNTGSGIFTNTGTFKGSGAYNSSGPFINPVGGLVSPGD